MFVEQQGGEDYKDRRSRLSSVLFVYSAPVRLMFLKEDFFLVFLPIFSGLIAVPPRSPLPTPPSLLSVVIYSPSNSRSLSSDLASRRDPENPPLLEAAPPSLHRKTIYFYFSRAGGRFCLSRGLGILMAARRLCLTFTVLWVLAVLIKESYIGTYGLQVSNVHSSSACAISLRDFMLC